MNLPENLTGHTVELLRSETTFVKPGDKGVVSGYAFPRGKFLHNLVGYSVKLVARMPRGVEVVEFYFTRNEIKDLGTREGAMVQETQLKMEVA